MRNEIVFNEFVNEQLKVVERMIGLGMDSDKAVEMLDNILKVASKVLGVSLDIELENRYSVED